MEIDFSKKEEFYRDYEKIGPWLVLGLFIISAGLYTFYWIHSKNKEFEIIDTEAPDSKRGAVIMMLLPFLWFFITYGINFFTSNKYIQIIMVTGYFLVFFLMIKYTYDFCSSFGRITNTNAFGWLLLFVIPFVALPIMQSQLNSYFNRVIAKKRTKHHYG
jgi:hypothetical protein